jgi:hypothetical protein
VTADLVGRGKAIAERLNALAGDAVPSSRNRDTEPGTDNNHRVDSDLIKPRPKPTDFTDPYADVPPADEEQVSKSLLARMITAAELQHMQFDPLREFVAGIITEGFGILAGPPKLGKSWWILAVALAVAIGGKALGLIKVEERPVLYLALEDSRRRMQSRCALLLGTDDFPTGLDILTAKDVKPGCVAATIKEWLARNPGGLVFLDTLGKARPQRRSGDDPYIADYQFGSQLKRLVDDVPGSGLVAAHHTRKMLAEDFLDTLSGTQGIAGSADYVLVLSRKRKSAEGVLSVTGRDIEENEFALTVDNGRWSLDGQDMLDAAATVNTRRAKEKETNLGSRSLDAVKFVNDRETTTPADLAEHLGIDNQPAGKLLGTLHDGGHIDKISRGVYVSVTGKSGKSGKNTGQEPDRSPADFPLFPDFPRDDNAGDVDD